MAYTIQGTVEGVAPILFNAFSEDATEKLRAGTTGGKFTDEQRVAEAMQKIHRDSNGGIGWPSWNFKQCLIEGCKRAGLREGRSSMAPFIAATVFVDGERTFGVESPDAIHEVAGRRPPKTGGAVLIKRPMLKAGWRLPFVLSVLDDRRSPDHIRTALGEAGMLVGMGSWRPEYGRFVVTEWNVER